MPPPPSPTAAADDPTSLLTPPCGPAVRSATLASVAALTSFVLTRLNTFAVVAADGRPAPDALVDAVTGPRGGRGLLTVSNHTSTLDDPALFAAALPLSLFATDAVSGAMRWALCARDVCFKGPLLARFFLSGKTLPIDRGAGALQPSTLAAGAALAAGGWVHVFPEGRIGYSGTLLPARRGVGAMVCACVLAGAPPPILLPLHHAGMGAVMPRGARVPRVGKRVTLTVGEAVRIDDLTPGCAAADPAPTWAAIAARAEAALRELEAGAPRNVDQRRDKERGGGGGGESEG